jgi:NADH-quinone oxidoreductase subunit N
MLFNINSLLQDVARDSLAFLPELLLCGSIVLLLLLRLFSVFDRFHLGYLALVLTLAMLGVSYAQWHGGWGLPDPEQETQIRLGELQQQLEKASAPGPEQKLDLARVNALKTQIAAAKSSQAQPIYNGLLVYDRMFLFLRLFLYGFTALIIWLSLLTGIPDREDSADFYCLLLGAVLGMALMASANHLLMIYIAVEMASLPSYALAGFLKGRRQSSEAALKYVVYGGGASGVMLYGISLLAGKFGTAYMPDLAVAYVTAVYPPGVTGIVFDPLLVLGTLFILVGIAFKLAAVPFHFWCPDVFEGAAAEVAGFLSVASKGAAIVLLARVALTLSGLEPLVLAGAGKAHWMEIVRYLLPTLAFFAALTATFGNLAAYLQTNLKRLLAYSTIAHAGYMMMGLACLTREGTGAVLYYLIAYLFTNLGAFAVVAFLRNLTGSEDLADYRGLVRRAPWMVVTLSVFLLSLLGIPPLVGFAAKFQVFAAVFDAGRYYDSLPAGSGLAVTLYILLGIGILNTVLSAVYYIKVMRVMILDPALEDVEGRPPRVLPEPAGAVVYATLMALVLLGLGIVVNPLVGASNAGVKRFAAEPGRPVDVTLAKEPGR